MLDHHVTSSFLEFLEFLVIFRIPLFNVSISFKCKDAKRCKVEGEYTALCAAGVMSFEDGLKLVKLRGEAMQEAAT